MPRRFIFRWFLSACSLDVREKNVFDAILSVRKKPDAWAHFTRFANTPLRVTHCIFFYSRVRYLSIYHVVTRRCYGVRDVNETKKKFVSAAAA